MTAYHFVELGCDHPDCDQMTGVVDLTAGALRATVHKEGWLHRNGKDYCPSHEEHAAREGRLVAPVATPKRGSHTKIYNTATGEVEKYATCKFCGGQIEDWGYAEWVHSNADVDNGDDGKRCPS